MRYRQAGGGAETVLRFLSSVGDRAEAELYLRVFRSSPRGHFALIAPTSRLLAESMGTLAEQLAYLHELGLTPCICLGVFDSVTPRLLKEFLESLSYVQVAGQLISTDDKLCPEDVVAQLEAQPREETVMPVLAFQRSSNADFAALCQALRPRKIMILRGSGGLGPKRAGSVQLASGHHLQTNPGGISVINLRSDGEDLRNSGILNEEEGHWLSAAETILEQGQLHGQSSSLAIASPLSLLRDLFTVKGEGTLIKEGAEILRFDAYSEVNQGDLIRLLTESFERQIKNEFFLRTPQRLYLENLYRGVAIIEKGEQAAFLSKFAVMKVAQGEGLGQALWWEVQKDYPALYWRARSNNSINAWYTAVADGFQRVGEWIVFWKGCLPESLPTLISDALARPYDFEEKGQLLSE